MARGAVTIRRATAADRDFIEQLGKRTVMDSVPATRRDVDPSLVFASYDRLLDIVRHQSNEIFIAESDGKPTGFVILMDSLPDEVTGAEQGFIAYMAVDRAHRKQGIGAALLAHAEDEARRRGLAYISLMVTDDNAPARELYERAGYVTERRLLCKTL